jgi:uncharacterized phiE125 gp8 family phage protein
MSLLQVTQPAEMPVSLHEVKAQCRVVGNDEDAVLAGYIRAATDWVESSTGLRLITQTWAWSTDAWPNRWCRYLRLPLAPVQSITEVSYLNTSGLPQVLSPSIYTFRGERLMLAPEATWPSIWHGLDVITVTFVVGFGPDHNYVPESIRQAVQMLAAYWFSQREAASIGPDSGPVSHVPFGVRELLEPFQLWAV